MMSLGCYAFDSASRSIGEGYRPKSFEGCAQEVLGSALNRAATFRLGLMLAEMRFPAGLAVDSQAGGASAFGAS